MRRRDRAFLAACLLLPLPALLCPAGARAEVIVGESLEWMIADSERVVRGTVVGVDSTPGQGAVVWDRVTFRVEETLKGDRADEVTFLVRRLGDENVLLNWRTDRVEVLVGLVQAERYRRDDPGYGRAPWTLRVHGGDWSAVRLNDKR